VVNSIKDTGYHQTASPIGGKKKYEAHERKRSNKEDLVTKCMGKSLQVWLLPIKVGRRFHAKKVRIFSALGVYIHSKGRSVQKLTLAEDMASYWVWMRRENRTCRLITDN
jgi:hypothetical protein